MSINSIAGNVYSTFFSAPTTAAGAARTGFSAASASGTPTAVSGSAAAGATDSFSGLGAELQSMLLQLQGDTATQPSAGAKGAVATGSTSTAGTTGGTATTSAANLSQTLSADMQQALQAYAGGAATTSLPALNV